MAQGIKAGQGFVVTGMAVAMFIGAFFLLRPVDIAEVSGPVDSETPAVAADAVPSPVLPDEVSAEAADRTVAQAPTNELPETPAPPAASIDELPRLDVIRIDARGAAVVAGRSARETDVILRLDGEEVAAAKTDRDGNFVSLFEIAPAQAPRVLTVESRDLAGAVVRSSEGIIVAPTFPDAPAPGDAPEIAQSGSPAEAAAVASSEGTRVGAPAQAAALDDGAGQAGTTEAKAAPLDTASAPGSDAELTAPDAPSDAATSAQVAGTGSPVSAPTQAPRLFRAGPGGLSVIATGTAAPQVRENLGIDAISYDAQGAVSLAGTGARDTDLRIYLDDQPVQLARVGAGGLWSSPLPNVETGVYTLRVDAVAADGSVQSRVETPFQRTAPEVAAASRRDGITAITVQPGFTLWAISEGYFGDGVQYVQIFENNRDQIRDPDLIYPGQVFNLPDAD